MKKYLVFALLLFFSKVLIAQSITGTWSGELNVQSMKLPLVLHIQQSGDSLTSTLDSPAQGVNGIPVDKTVFANNELQLEVKIISAAYKGTLAGDSISGTFKQMGMESPLILKRGATTAKPIIRPQMPKPPFNYNIKDVSVTNAAEGNTLAGTITTPKNKKDFPIVVLITGSGPHNRDEEMFGHKPFWVIADHFADHGIGTLRLDDRGVGASSPVKANFTTANLATDIDAAVNFLVKQGYKNIGLVGHSEGGLIAPMVANNNKNVKFIVSLAGPAINIDEFMVHQNETVLRSTGATEEMIRKSDAEVRELYKFINSRTGDNIEAELATYLASLDLPTIPKEQRETFLNQRLKYLSSPWFRYWIKFTPNKYVATVKIPVLAINGTKDIQVFIQGKSRCLESFSRKSKKQKF